MSVNVVLNGTTYVIPDPGDNTWGQDLTDYFVAISTGVLQKAGGSFTLTAEVDFGATYGLKSSYLKSRTANVSSTGTVRLAKTDFIGWRDNANANDLELGIDASDNLTWNGNPLVPSTALTASRAVVTNASGVLTTSATTSTEIGYVSGVTSAIQTQINGKQATGNYITALTGDVTASGPGSVAATIGANKVTNAMLAQVATQTFKGRTTAATGNVEDLTVTQATALLNAFVGDSGSGGTKGLVPAPASGDAAALKFLKADGTWATPTGAGDVVGPAASVDSELVLFNGITGKLIKRAAGTGAVYVDSGVVTQGTLPIAKGGTGQTSANPAFNALSPMTTAGDLIYGGASGAGTRLAVGSAFKKLQSDGTNPTWSFGEAQDNGTEGAGTTTLTIASNPNQLTTLSAARTYVLPTTSVPAGYPITITNNGDFALTINASGGTAVATLHVGTIRLVARIATPTAKADWIVQSIISKTTYSSTFSYTGGSGGSTSGSVSIVLERAGNFVRVYAPGPVATSGTSNTAFAANTSMPTAFFPTAQCALPYNAVRNNGGSDNQAGIFIVTTGGVVKVQRSDTGTAFSNSVSCGFQEDFQGIYYSAL
jgi:hypothetical protein